MTRRQMIMRARKMRKNPTPAEKRLWGQLRKRRLAGRKFRRQHVLGRYIVDFFCFSEQLAVEIDGPSHDEERRARDRVRDEVMSEVHNVRVVRFSNDDVMGELGRVLCEIRAVLEGE